MITEPWTKEDVATLRRLVKKGLSRGEIAKKMGRTRNAVCGSVNRYIARRKGGKGRDGKQIFAVAPAEIPRPDTEGGYLLDLSHDQCRYPLERQWMFCGEPTEHGSYCAHHAALCYRAYQPTRPEGFRLQAWSAA